MLSRLAGRFYRTISFPPIRATLGFFWVGGAIGLGSASTALLPQGRTALAPLLLALGALVGYYSFVRVVERRPVVELVSRGSLTEALAGAAIGFGLFGLVIGILFLLDVYSVSRVNVVSVVVPALMTALMAGVTEELLIRAVAFRILEGWLGSWLALGISAALFGLMHLPNPQATIVSSAAIALEAGVMLAAAYMVTRRVWLAIGIHAAWNFAQSGIFGVAASGVESTGYLKGDLHGATLLSGGAFGPEASIVAVVVCLAAGLVMLRVAHDRGHVLRPSWRPEPTAAQRYRSGSTVPIDDRA
jgi:membrane protease YdiL (CAAX protease family)